MASILDTSSSGNIQPCLTTADTWDGVADGSASSSPFVISSTVCPSRRTAGPPPPCPITAVDSVYSASADNVVRTAEIGHHHYLDPGLGSFAPFTRKREVLVGRVEKAIVSCREIETSLRTNLCLLAFFDQVKLRGDMNPLLPSWQEISKVLILLFLSECDLTHMLQDFRSLSGCSKDFARRGREGIGSMCFFQLDL